MRETSSRSPSIVSIPDSDGSDYTPIADSPAKRTSLKRKRTSVATTSISTAKKANGKDKVKSEVIDIEDSAGPSVSRDHGSEYHSVDEIVKSQKDLLDWFESCRETRGMPWRKRYDSELIMEEKGQRAYEIWVSEVMLQQTQVATVIAYWKRWIEKWPTIADLAKADVEEVNAMWRGLGYYRRARSLLAGAKTVMSKSKYQGRLPDDPAVLEKEIDGVGRYTAGAICSMAYGVRTPIVDGNIHRLLSRLLAAHAPQTSPSTVKFLWTSAERLVNHLPEDKGIAGDWNQALMELGSQVCKPVSPDCGSCPLRKGCKAYSELSRPPPLPQEMICTLCASIPSSSDTDKISSVTIFPMRKEKKTSRSEEESVLVLEWRGESDDDRKWLFVKRPEKGLLAGLFEPPTSPVPTSSSPSKCLAASLNSLQDYLESSAEVGTHRYVSSIPHIFSHINMTYHIHHSVITSPAPPPILASAPRSTVWLDKVEVDHANVGTGVKKVWAEVYGSWGSFDLDNAPKGKKIKKGNSSATKKKPLEEVVKNGKIVKKIMMPAMPTRKVKDVV
ncbi:A/G-specific adenine glycosylase [Kwoniella mangroviensis CBS 8507]|uniref:A/G-specific adenine glycosylase n=1 Tax=Kwoniella mangroviensis CBS 8507 TaxID=1296122 RepID=UPI00080D450A|nr:A/G-specific adenine glycosylase [Kwoniella mangroviensis CBS 8507]OCF70636.1 A/G-specific adenine glycosylase [Kwoniella mangroviensis CBS 8507]